MIYILLFLVSVYDVLKRIIPHWIIWPALAGAVLIKGFACLWGFGLGVLIIHVLNCIGLTKTKGGDAKLLGLIGAFFGWKAAILIGLLAPALSCMFRIIRKLPQREPLPYAPFLTVATFLVKWYA